MSGHRGTESHMVIRVCIWGTTGLSGIGTLQAGLKSLFGDLSCLLPDCGKYKLRRRG